MRNLSKSRMLAGTAFMLAGSFAAQPASATLIAHFVDATFPNNSSLGTGQFDSASITVNINPSLTNWIAWNNAPTVAIPHASCGVNEPNAGFCLGGAMDDYVRITVTNPGGFTSIVNYDRNDGFNNPLGQQNVIFGAADVAPDARRNNFSAVFTTFDQAGASNAVFNLAGDYTFDFSFQNEFLGGAFHPDIYLLVDSNPPPPSADVPEPMTLSLLGAGLAGIGWVRRRRAETASR